MLFCSFSTFQSRNAHIQRLNFDQIDPFSQMTQSLLHKFKKLRKSEPGGGSGQEISVLSNQGKDT